MKKKMIAAFAVAIALMMTACGASSGSSADSTAAVSTSEIADELEVSEVDDIADDSADGGMTDSVEVEEAQSGEKIIYTYNYYVETKSFDDFMSTVNSRISEYGGYMESSSIDGNVQMNISRYAQLVIRIPTERMHDFLQMVEDNSNVTNATSSSENVTLTYVDLESHVKALQTEQETLMELLEKAESTEDLINIQSQLTNVRYELESYESQLRVYDNRIDYSTLYLNIDEVDRESSVATKLTYGQEISKGLSDTMYGFGQGLRSFSIWVIVHLPILLMLAVLVALVLWIARKCRKKHQERYMKNTPRTGVWSAEAKAPEEKNSSSEDK